MFWKQYNNVENMKHFHHQKSWIFISVYVISFDYHHIPNYTVQVWFSQGFDVYLRTDRIKMCVLSINMIQVKLNAKLLD